jgi:Toprim domain-containing protein/CHC2-type zinc finger protein
LTISAEKISDASRADVLQAAERLGPKLRRDGPHFVGACPAGCAKKDGFIVTPEKRIFLCRPSGAAGDVIAMVQHALGTDFAGAIEFLTGTETRPVSRETYLSKSAFDPRTEATVARIVTSLLPLRWTAGEAYLARRAIDVEAIADVLTRVDAIGWHPAVYFNEPGHELHSQRLGCIVGVMTDAVTARPTGAISRTYLDKDGRKIAKAKTLGSPAGLVRLSEDADVLGGLFLAEGLETALAAMAIGLSPVWSTGSTALMAGFPLLNGIECLTLLADHDASGAGEKAALDAKAPWIGVGREVRILRRAQRGDLNDAIRAAS